MKGQIFMKEILFVGIGGFVGASLRYLISNITPKIFGNQLPYGTLIVNVLGCLFIGFLLGLYTSTDYISDSMKLFLTTGLLGGLTTFSTFSSETMAFFTAGNYISGFANMLLNLCFGFAAVILGRFLALKIV